MREQQDGYRPKPVSNLDLNNTPVGGSNVEHPVLPINDPYYTEVLKTRMEIGHMVANTVQGRGAHIRNTSVFIEKIYRKYEELIFGKRG